MIFQQAQKDLMDQVFAGLAVARLRLRLPRRAKARQRDGGWLRRDRAETR